MTARSIRRAAERKQKKLARKAAQASNSQPVISPETQSSQPIQTISQAQLAAMSAQGGGSPLRAIANRANAELSTGPTSAEGKAKSSLNAVKTGLTGRTVLLPTDDAEAYRCHVHEFELEYHPSGARECTLVQSIADTFWRLDRIRSLEMAIFARGRTEFAEDFAHEDPSSRPALIDVQTFLTYEKQIRNLQIQEARLFRRYEKESAELRQLQQERRSRELETSEALERRPQSLPRARNGFDFSTHAFESRSAPPAASKTAESDEKTASGGPELAASAA